MSFEGWGYRHDTLPISKPSPDSRKEIRGAGGVLEVRVIRDFRPYTRVADRIRTESGDSPDIVTRRLKLGGEPEENCAIVYLNGLSDPEMVNNFVMDSLLRLTPDLYKGEEPDAFLTTL